MTPADVEAAALQFVRKVAGTRNPSKANREAFEAAVVEIAAVTRQMLNGWVTQSARSSPEPRRVAIPAKS